MAKDDEVIDYYLNEIKDSMYLFDVPLHFNFYNASINPDFDMSKLLEKTLRTMKEVQEARKGIKENEREAGLVETKEGYILTILKLG